MKLFKVGHARVSLQRTFCGLPHRHGEQSEGILGRGKACAHYRAVEQYDMLREHKSVLVLEAEAQTQLLKDGEVGDVS